MYEATKLRLNADLKIGTSLSGGIDSSVIFTLLNLIQSNDKKIDEKKLDLNPTIMNYLGCKTSDEAIAVAKRNNKKYKVIEFNNDKIEKHTKFNNKIRSNRRICYATTSISQSKKNGYSCKY